MNCSGYFLGYRDYLYMIEYLLSFCYSEFEVVG